MRLRFVRRLFSAQSCIAVFLYAVVIVTAANWFSATLTNFNQSSSTAADSAKIPPKSGSAATTQTRRDGSVVAAQQQQTTALQPAVAFNPRPVGQPALGEVKVKRMGQRGIGAETVQVVRRDVKSLADNNRGNNEQTDERAQAWREKMDEQRQEQQRNEPGDIDYDPLKGHIPDENPPPKRSVDNINPRNVPKPVEPHPGYHPALGQAKKLPPGHVKPSGPYIVPRRIVHFDLKGAPPKPAYLIQIFKLIKQAGATGILMEWEDMFPYTGQLANATSLNAYTEADVAQILEAAQSEQLDIIPLVQTFAHLEWILKLEQFHNLRDTHEYATVMCVAQPEAWELLQEMVNQVISTHQKYGMPFFHVGCDEVFQVGGCSAARGEMQKLGNNKDRYMMWHIARMAKHIKTRTQDTTNVLIWHDMIANANAMHLRDSGLYTLVEPVVWNYAEDIDHYMSPAVWETLKPFGYVWGSSSYKGADGPMRYHANPNHYVRNHHSWLRTISAQHNKYKEFRGIILTGWSRYDHFAVLCEILPVGVPSLLMCLITLTTGSPNAPYAQKTKELAGCSMQPTNVNGQCRFPGSVIYSNVQNLRALREELPRDIYNDKDPGFEFNGWLGRMNLAQAFSSNWYLNKLIPKVNNYFNRFANIYKTLEREMLECFYEDTVAEWLYEYIGKDLEQLGAVRQKAAKIKTQVTFPRRPLPGVQPQLDYLRQIVNT